MAVLLNQVDDEINKIYSQFEFDWTEGRSDEKLADVMEYCNPKRYILYETYVFKSLSQIDSGPTYTFVKSLKTQAVRSKSADIKDRLLLCRVVLSDPELKERLLRDKDVTLAKFMGDIHAAEITKRQLSRMADGNKSSISRQLSLGTW